MRRPLRVGLAVEGQEGVTWDAWRRLATHARVGGFDALLCTDHYLSCRTGPDPGGLDAWATVVALAATVPELRVGTLVSPVGFRQPAILARTALTASAISGGRIDVGLGAGWNEAEHRAFGFSFGTMADRLDRLDSHLRTLRRLWSEAPEGLLTATAGAPALVVGADRGPRAVRLAARWADELNTRTASPSRCARVRSALDAACRAMGREPAEVGLSVLVNYVVAESDAQLPAAAARIAALRGDRVGDVWTWLDERRDRWIAGTPDEVARRLRALHDAGASRVILMHADPGDPGPIDLLAREVLARL